MNKNKNLFEQERIRVVQIAPKQQIERSLVEELIKKSAYWYSHPSGHPVSAPKHHKRIYDPMGRAYALVKALSDENDEDIPEPFKNDWKIDFGSNTFLISKAIMRCQTTLLNSINKAEKRETIKIIELKDELKLNVRASVANHRGQEYEGYYSGFDGNHLIFGVQSISTEDFVNVLLKEVNIFRIFQLK